MKQLTTLQVWIMNVGGLAMLASVILRLFIPTLPALSCALLFLSGSMAFSCMQMLQRYEGSSLTIRRLRSIQVAADLLFIFTGFYRMLPFIGVYHIPFLNLTTWRNEWLVFLLLGAILELYSAFRLAYELEKER